MTESGCTCTELEQLTVCHDMRNEPHLVGCPRWGSRRQNNPVTQDEWADRCDNCGQPVDVCGSCVEDEEE